MIKTIKFPAPQLSQLKEVVVDLDLTGKHYKELALSEGKFSEEVALSVVRDLLLEGDASKLTLSELRYIFTLVKINSLEDDYTATVYCTLPNKEGNKCNCENHFKIKLSDADLNPTPKNYKVPTIKFVAESTEKLYKILPPTIDFEIALYDWLLTAKNISKEDLEHNKECQLDYAFIRAVGHLVDENGQRLIKDFSDFEPVMSYYDVNKYQTITALNKYVVEVNSFGVQNKVHEFKCKECGGTLKFQLPLLYGLVM